MSFTYVSPEIKHLEFFGLHSNPFPIVPDDDAFYAPQHIEQIITEIVYGITSGKGFMVMTGEVGLGKTTIARKIITVLDKEGVETALVLQTACQGPHLLKEIIRDFGITCESIVDAEHGFGDQMNCLREFLVRQNQQGKNCAIIVDDAQSLNHESLELIRMISNIETSRQKLVQILLIGQPELLARLNETSLRQLKSRIIIQQKTRPMTCSELKRYVDFKLNRAGNTGLISVDLPAIKAVFKHAGGNFRHSNILLDRCLHVACLKETKLLTKEIVNLANDGLAGKEHFWNKKAVALGSFLGFLLILAGAVNFYDLDLYRVFKASGVHLSQLSEATHARANSELLRSSPVYEPSTLQDSIDQELTGLQAIKTFLAAYGLSKFETSFFAAIKSKHLERTAQVIFDETGYQLIQLTRVPDHVRVQYGILSYPLPDQQGKSHYLFWKPVCRIDKFYYAYTGQEIYALQEIMTKINFYNAGLDGVVGKNLMKGITAFQKRAGLTLTGYPDDQTIFLLCHFEGNN